MPEQSDFGSCHRLGSFAFSVGAGRAPGYDSEHESGRHQRSRGAANLSAFAVRLNNGVRYIFNRPRNFGAPEDYRMIFFFGETEAVRIDTNRIVEIIEQPV